jgi:NADH dehydrogenase [ubiquinone] 1 alpha subcomplex assembly factor 2
LVRQERLKVLAAEADRRWAAKPGFLEGPGRGALEGVVRGGEVKGVSGELGEEAKEGEGRNTAMEAKSVAEMPVVEQDVVEEPTPEDDQKQRPSGSTFKEKTYKEDPWKQARGAPSEEWQPAAWTPNNAAKR